MQFSQTSRGNHPPDWEVEDWSPSLPAPTPMSMYCITRQNIHITYKHLLTAGSTRNVSFTMVMLKLITAI